MKLRGAVNPNLDSSLEFSWHFSREIQCNGNVGCNWPYLRSYEDLQIISWDPDYNKTHDRTIFDHSRLFTLLHSTFSLVFSSQFFLKFTFRSLKFFFGHQHHVSWRSRGHDTRHMTAWHGHSPGGVTAWLATGGNVGNPDPGNAHWANLNI